MEKYSDRIKIGEGGGAKIYKMNVIGSFPPLQVAVKYLKSYDEKDGVLGTSLKEISMLLSLVYF
jgi:hypothetical protein